MEDIFAEERQLRLKAKAEQMRRTARIALELGTRGAARRMAVDPDTVTQWLQSTGLKPVEPVWLEIRIERFGPVFSAVVKGGVRRYQGKQPKTVPFRVEARGRGLGDALEAAVYEACLSAWEAAGHRYAEALKKVASGVPKSGIATGT